MATPLPPEWSTWAEQGARLLSAPPLRRSEQVIRGPEDPKFALGDLLVTVPSPYVDLLAEHLGRDAGQFRVYREVAERIPPHRRVQASWTVHRDLRERPDLLRDALTVREAAALLGKKPIDSKADRRLTLAERAAKVREALADEDVLAVIDAELADSRSERNARKLANRIVSDHSQRQRELEKERRELRTAMSQLEATVKAELKVNEATQLIEAIAQSVDDLHQPERVITAIAELGVVITQFLLDQDPAVPDPIPTVIDPHEVWQARSARAASTDSNQRDLSREGRAVIDQVD